MRKGEIKQSLDLLGVGNEKAPAEAGAFSISSVSRYCCGDGD
jgi:hypothetical protein